VSQERRLKLVLYVSPTSAASARARRNLDGLLARLASPAVELDVRDVSEDTEEAEADRILFTPTLVVRQPIRSWIVGDLGNADEVLHLLRLAETEEAP